MGSRNHEIVPINLIARMTKLRPQTVTRQLQGLAKNKLVSFESDSKCKCVQIATDEMILTGVLVDEGVRLTYGGYDFLALKAFSSRSSVLSIGQQIGVGKESDIYLVHGTFHHESNSTDFDERGGGNDGDHQEDLSTAETCVESPEAWHERVLKIQRLGRTSFRTVKTNRDYHQHRKSCSWLYLSRLAAGLEFRFMRALREAGMPVPKPLDWNRHCVVMEWIRGTLLDNVRLNESSDVSESCDDDDSDRESNNDSNTKSNAESNNESDTESDTDESNGLRGKTTLSTIAKKYSFFNFPDRRTLKIRNRK
jgi:RIO kinase 2